MKKLLFAVSALAALALLAPSTGFAQTHVYSNQVGLYTTPDGHGDTGIADIGAPVFECTLAFDPVPNNNLFMLAANLPPSSLNVGNRTNINEGFLDFIVGIDVNNPVPVVDDAATLITFQFINNSVEGFTVSLIPTEVPSIPGKLAFQGVSGELRELYPSSGDHGTPVFRFGSPVVAVESESFGTVKALFR